MIEEGNEASYDLTRKPSSVNLFSSPRYGAAPQRSIETVSEIV
jgi:hypothetical protein